MIVLGVGWNKPAYHSHACHPMDRQMEEWTESLNSTVLHTELAMRYKMKLESLQFLFLARLVGTREGAFSVSLPQVGLRSFIISEAFKNGTFKAGFLFIVHFRVSSSYFIAFIMMIFYLSSYVPDVSSLEHGLG